MMRMMRMMLMMVVVAPELQRKKQRQLQVRPKLYCLVSVFRSC
jgi:hypothetical protein